MTAQIQTVPIDTLTPYRNNARTHSKKQIRQIADSIKRFGFTNPILVDGKGGVIAGHGRLAAAKLLGMKEVPTILLSHLSETEQRAYVIADNQLAAKAGWDKEILAIELQALVDLDFDVSLTGFDIPEVDLIISEFSPDNRDDDDEDAEPAPLEKSAGPAVTRVGDVFVLGDHRLVCGNALSADVFQQLMQGEKAGVCFTDPPYNVPIAGNVSGLGKTKHREFAMASGEMSDDEFAEFLEQSFSQIAASCVPGAIAFICMDWRHVAETIDAGRHVFGDLLNLCVWNKTNAGMGSLYRSQHELVLVFRNGKAPHRNNVELGKHGRHRSNVWTYRGVNSFGAGRMEDLEAHPTVKPVNLVADALLDVSRRGDIVLDPFGGSGTTLLAAHKTGRSARLVEIDPLYCDLIVRRFEKHTGKQARLAATGQTFEELGEERAAASASVDSTSGIGGLDKWEACCERTAGRDPANKGSKKSGDYEVGYGKPPVGSRFKKGKSGNVNGRPKEKKNMKTMIEKMLYAPIQIQQNGNTTTVPALEAILLKMRNNALAGDFRSAVQAIQLASYVPDTAETDGAQADATPLDPKLIVTLMRDYLDQRDPAGEDSKADGGNASDEKAPKGKKGGA